MRRNTAPGKATGSASRHRRTGSESDPAVEIRVADRGPGIPADEQAHIFEPFFRGRRALQDQIHGTGLGLNLAKKIVEAHGGSIQVKSVAMKGAEFIVRLPAAPAGEAVMSARILLVEDEPGLVMTLSDLLGAEGYEVESATDGPSGLSKALKEKFDLIVLDVMLPGKSGLEVCRELRQQGNDVAVLMLTAKTQLYDRVVGLKLGADDYLTKPFEPPELLARIEALLRRVKHDKLSPVTRFQFGNVEIDFERGEVHKGGVGAESGGQGTRSSPLPDRSPRQRGFTRRTAGGGMGVSTRRVLPHHRCARRLAPPKAGRQLRRTRATFTRSAA